MPQKDETTLVAAIAKGPVSVAIEADKSAFQLYKGGVLDNATAECSSSPTTMRATEFNFRSYVECMHE